MENWNPKPLDPGQITLHRRAKANRWFCCIASPVLALLGRARPLMDRNELLAYSFPGHHERLCRTTSMARRN